jgi:phospholipid/cholesterol/gamma-HCH transport system substrate-binding protein
MNDAMENLSKASSQLKELTEKLNAGEGSLGRLINDDALIQKLDSVVTDLNDLISDIKKHPGRYMTIRLF